MTVSVSVRVLPAASRAVTVSTFEPDSSAMPFTDHAVVPVAVPLPPRLLLQVTCVTATLSEALPPRLMLDEKEMVDELLVGDVIGCSAAWYPAGCKSP